MELQAAPQGTEGTIARGAPGIPEAFKVLVKELQALAMDVDLLDQEGNSIDMDALAKEAEKEERKINANIRNLVGESSANTTSVVEEDSLGSVVHSIDELND